MKRPEGPRAPSGPMPPRRGLGRFTTVVLIAVPLVVAALLLRTRKESSAPSVDGKMLDSLVAADARGDRVATLIWAERLGAKYPRDHDVLLARGTAWSDYAVEQRARRLLLRPALRTSLERIECKRLALTLMDSSTRVTSAPKKWVDSMNRLAEVEETLGLPGEALIHYELIKLRRPREFSPIMRAYWLRALLYDPVHPDTSEWHRRMQGMHLR